jgi:hypothetical protein
MPKEGCPSKQKVKKSQFAQYCNRRKKKIWIWTMVDVLQLYFSMKETDPMNPFCNWQEGPALNNSSLKVETTIYVVQW